MDWAGWALFGLLATAVLTAVMIVAQLAGLSRLDLPLILGTVTTPDPDRARVAGFLIHVVLGQAFALGYAVSFVLLGRATWWLGQATSGLGARMAARKVSLLSSAMRRTTPQAKKKISAWIKRAA